MTMPQYAGTTRDSYAGTTGKTEDAFDGYVSLTPTDFDVTMPELANARPRDDAAKPLPERCKILHDGAALTNGDRDMEYGPPAVNMAASGALKDAFRSHMTRDISLAELEAIEMCLTKLGRIATGTPKRDTYVDAATYLAIAGEIALDLS